MLENSAESFEFFYLRKGRFVVGRGCQARSIVVVKQVIVINVFPQSVSIHAGRCDLHLTEGTQIIIEH